MQRLKKWISSIELTATTGDIDLTGYATLSDLNNIEGNVSSNSAKIQTLEEQDAIGEKSKAQVVTVAKSGGDYTTIQSAIDSITDATTTKRYAILVYPGDYAESVTMKDYVDIIGSGRTNSRITATSGTALTFPATKGTVLDIGIYVNYGTLGVASTAITSAGADSVMIGCDIGVTKASGNYVMNGIKITAGSFRMSDCYFTWSVTGSVAGGGLVQSAIVQTGVLTTVIMNNNEITMTSVDAGNDLAGFETTANVTGTCLLANNVIFISTTTESSATGIWAYGTSTGAIFNQNRLTVNCNASAYGFYIESTAGGAVIDTRHNEIIITSRGTAESAYVDSGDTWNSVFDKITAANGYSGAGTITFSSSSINGFFTATGTIATATLNVGASTAVTSILDEDDMASNSATALATQQSIKAYVLATLAGGVSAFTTSFTATCSADTTLANNTATKIAFDTVGKDNNSEWDAGNTRWECQDAGDYYCIAKIRFDSNATGYRQIFIYKNGVNVQGFLLMANTGDITHIMIDFKLDDLIATDYIEIYGKQTSGGNLNVDNTATSTTWQMIRVL